MNTESLTGRTTRPVTFGIVDHRTKVVTDIRSFPAGTQVYVSETKGGLIARVCGTLYSQQVYASAVEPF